MISSRLHCDRCGRGETDHGMNEVPYMRLNISRSIGICGECYAVLCSDCADNRQCSECASPFPLLLRVPTSGPPWWKIGKWLKWKQIWIQSHKFLL